MIWEVASVAPATAAAPIVWALGPAPAEAPNAAVHGYRTIGELMTDLGALLRSKRSSSSSSRSSSSRSSRSISSLNGLRSRTRKLRPSSPSVVVFVTDSQAVMVAEDAGIESFSADQVQFRNTITIDLTLSEDQLLAAMSQTGGSDLFVSRDFPPSMKLQGAMKPMTQQKLTGEVTRALALALMNERQREEFARDLECNFAISVPGVSRFRVNVFRHLGGMGAVMRAIPSQALTLEQLGQTADAEAHFRRARELAPVACGGEVCQQREALRLARSVHGTNARPARGLERTTRGPAALNRPERGPAGSIARDAGVAQATVTASRRHLVPVRRQGRGAVSSSEPRRTTSRP